MSRCIISAHATKILITCILAEHSQAPAELFQLMPRMPEISAYNSQGTRTITHKWDRYKMQTINNSKWCQYTSQ